MKVCCFQQKTPQFGAKRRNLVQNAVQFGAKRIAIWCKTQCNLVQNAVQFGAKHNAICC